MSAYICIFNFAAVSMDTLNSREPNLYSHRSMPKIKKGCFPKTIERLEMLKPIPRLPLRNSS